MEERQSGPNWPCWHRQGQRGPQKQGRCCPAPAAEAPPPDLWLLLRSASALYRGL